MKYILTLDCPDSNVTLDLDLITTLINFQLVNNVFSLDEIVSRVNNNWSVGFHNSIKVISIIPKLSNSYLDKTEELKDKKILEKINLCNSIG